VPDTFGVDLEPSDIIAAIGVVVALVSAIIGGGIAGFFSWFATSQQIKAERIRREQEATEKINSILSALYHELKTVWPTYMDSMGGFLEKWDEAKPFLVSFSGLENYYVIYYGNTQNIGLIPNPELRDKIIETYTALASLRGIWVFHQRFVDSMEASGEQFIKTKAAVPVIDIRSDEYHIARIQSETAARILSGKEPVLKDIFTKLRVQQVKAKAAVTDLISRLEPFSKK
jgi:hypothetical protein